MVEEDPIYQAFNPKDYITFCSVPTTGNINQLTFIRIIN